MLGARSLTAALLGIAVLLAAACGGAKAQDTPRVLASPPGVRLSIERVVRAETPAAFVFAPDGTLWYGELKSGRVFSGGKQRWDFAVSSGGESGLESMAISPDGTQLFAYLSVPKDDPGDARHDGGEASVSRVVALTIAANGGLSDPKTILEVPSNGIHNAGSLGFGPEGALYVDIGDNHNFGESQDARSPFGKVLRIDANGDPSSGNPFRDATVADPRVWALGIRNTFAFDWTPEGRLLGADNGENGDDEVNDIKPALNYGWPPAPADAPRAGDVAPLRVFHDTIAPSGLAVVPSAYGGWSGGGRVAVCGVVSRQMVLVDVDHPATAPLPIVDGCSLHLARDPSGTLVFANESGVWRLKVG